MNIITKLTNALLSTTSEGADARPFEQMNGAGLVAAYNRMVTEATAAGLTGYREVARFADQRSGIKRCEALQSSLAARASGLSAAERQPGVVAPPRVTRLAELVGEERAEEMRQEVLADQEAALIGAGNSGAAAEEETDVAKKAKKNGKKTVKQPRAPRAKKEPRAKAEWTLRTAMTLWNTTLVKAASKAGIEGVKTRKSGYFTEVNTAIKCLGDLAAKFKAAGVDAPDDLAAALESFKAR
jgi:hypothetical protein